MNTYITEYKQNSPLGMVKGRYQSKGFNRRHKALHKASIYAQTVEIETTGILARVPVVIAKTDIKHPGVNLPFPEENK
jgi:hypothetical protein